jgi:hypothetical protein
MTNRILTSLILTVFVSLGQSAFAQTGGAQSNNALSDGSAASQTVASSEGHRALGDSLRMAGDLPGAAQALYMAYQATPVQERGGEEGVAYVLASTLALIGNQNDHAFTILGETVPSLTSMKVLYDPDMYFLVKDNRWESVEESMLDRLSNEVSGTFDRELARTLLSMRRNEWVGRYHIMLLFRQTGGESPVLTLLSDGMGERHIQNEADLIGLLDEQGWPLVSAVGEDAAYAATNVLTHMGLEARQTYLPMLKAACESGEADWSEYAPSLDRTELESGRPQIYGTQMEMDEERGEYVPQNLIDPLRVDQRRAELGMEPIAAQLKRFNDSMKRDFEQ